MNRSVRAKKLACALLASAAFCGLTAAPASAQTAKAYRAPDANGVDLTWGDFLMNFTEGSIGSGPAELPLVRTGVWNSTLKDNGHQWDRVQLNQSQILGGGTNTIVVVGDRAESFTSTGTLPSGSTLSGSGGSYTYTTADGTMIAFTDPTGSEDSNSGYCNGSFGQTNCILLPTTITSPDGKTVQIEWDVWMHVEGMIGGDPPATITYFTRMSRISNSFGYAIAFAYGSDGTGGGFNPPSSWYQRTGASFYNDHVSTTTPQANISYSYPSSGVVEVTDMGGRVWRFTGSIAQITGIRRPGASSDTTSISYGTAGVSSVTRDGVTTSYSYGVSGSTATMVVTNALSQSSTIVSDLNLGRVTSATDPLSHTISYAYDTSGRLSRVTQPEGNYTAYTYDSRGNVTQTQMVPKSGSGLSTLTTSASFDSSCTNPVKCNKPNSTTDARGNTTDYTYDSTHGGLLTVTAPPPTTGATRPQTRYAYTLDSGIGIYELTGMSACQTGSSCAGTSDEVKTTIAYDSNGNTTSISNGNGSGTLTATTAMTYDALGNLLTADGPLSGTADTTRYRYNAARQLVGIVGPDPDGAGSLHNRAVRNTYTNGLLTKTEQGTVNSQSDTDWAAFSSLQEVDTAYDSNARPVTQSVASGSTTYALKQTSYDAVGRIQCVAQRMNPSVFGSLPSDACTLGTSGSFGSDRIVKTGYDAAGRASLVQSAYGVTGVQSDDVTTTYTSNGLVSTVTDAEGNKTTYGYDGLDRRTLIQYPDSTKGAGTSSSTHYEQYGFDENGNVTSFRNRANETIGFTYDALNRRIAKDLPGSEPDVSYSYDLTGHLTGASQSGNSLSYTYDALNRELTESGPQGTVTSTYDLAGRRTQITWPDSFYVNYDHLVTGEVAAVRENGATSGVGVLASYTYDDLGHRTALTRGNGTSTGYSHDAVSRLSSLNEDLSGSSYDQTLGFSYNPANQLIQNTRSNDIYAWAGHGSGSTATTTNGLNQLTAIGSTTPGYDSKGNMTYAGGTTYSYSSENLLTSSTGGASLTYDPAKRLYQVSGGAAGTQRFAYDGTSLVAEYNGSNAMLRRYVFGSGADDPIVWYEGSGTTDRRFLHADERGTIVAVTNSSGTMLSLNTFDEYGKNGASNAGRFQYTGQAYLPELGLYYYKARMYAAGLGRFMQADPIGYGDGMNVYSYVHADPVDESDPTGLAPSCDLENSWKSGNCGEENAAKEARAVAESKLHVSKDQAWTWSTAVIAFFNGTLSYQGLFNLTQNMATTQVILAGLRETMGQYIRGLDSHTNFMSTQGIPGLSYTTIAGGPKEGDWFIKWQLSSETTVGGYIIQHVIATALDGAIKLDYWEAWRVNPGQSTSTAYLSVGYDDEWRFATINAWAAFYQGVTLPSTFKTENHDTAAHALPSTTIDPHFPASRASNVVFRHCSC